MFIHTRTSAAKLNELGYWKMRQRRSRKFNGWVHQSQLKKDIEQGVAHFNKQFAGRRRVAV